MGGAWGPGGEWAGICGGRGQDWGGAERGPIDQDQCGGGRPWKGCGQDRAGPHRAWGQGGGGASGGAAKSWGWGPGAGQRWVRGLEPQGGMRGVLPASVLRGWCSGPSLVKQGLGVWLGLRRSGAHCGAAAEEREAGNRRSWACV